MSGRSLFLRKLAVVLLCSGMVSPTAAANEQTAVGAAPSSLRVFATLVAGRLESGSILTYLFPVYSFRGGRYRAERLTGPPVPGRYGFERVTAPPGSDAQGSRFVLRQVRIFTLYERGKLIGQYRVTGTEWIAVSGCRTDLVGVGKPAWLRHPDFRTGNPGLMNRKENARIVELVAVSGIARKDVRMIRPHALPAGERDFLTAVARERLKQFVKETALAAKVVPTGALRLVRAFSFDVEQASRPEVVAEFSASIAPVDYGDFSLEAVRISVFAKTGSDRRVLLIVLPYAIDLIQPVDLDGDGKAELLLGYGSGAMNFDLYALTKGSFINVLGEGVPSYC